MINIEKKSLKSAFTLIEMLVVMAHMALMIGVGVSSFYGIGGSSALSGSVNEVQGALSLARQQTVLQGSSVNIYFHVDGSTDDIVCEMWAMTNGTSVAYDTLDNTCGYKMGSVYYFPKGIDVKVDGTKIIDNADKYITLRPTGASITGGNLEIELTLPDKGYGYLITVYNITGLTSVKDI